MKLFVFKSIRQKMMFGFSFVIVLTILFNLLNLYVNSKVNDDASEIIEKELKLLIANEGMSLTMSERISNARGYLLSGDESYLKQFDKYTEQGKFFESIVREIGATEKFDQLIIKTIEWRTNFAENVVREYQIGNVEKARANLISMEATALELIKGYDEIANEQEVIINQKGQAVITNGERASLITKVGASIVIVISIIIAWITSNNISRPIQAVMKRIKLISEGDLSQEPLSTIAKDETGALVHSTNLLNEEFKKILNQIQHVSATVSTQSEELFESANEVKNGTIQIAATMQQLASGTETQANSASDLAEVMNSFAEQVEKANQDGEKVQSYSKEVLHMTNEGSQLMSLSTEQMVKIDQIVHEAVEMMGTLDARSQEITTLVSVIRDIAAQTNLLALNAAIEAARAGEHGKGFAVVAEEVRKLAEQVSLSVDNITGIVDNIQSDTSVVARSLQASYEEVEQGTLQIQTTGETFNRISEAVTNMVENIQGVSASLAKILASSQEMNGSVEEIASVAEEAAAGVQETAASAEEASSSLGEVVRSSEQLDEIVEELHKSIHRFKL